jgi:hypothetical protein
MQQIKYSNIGKILSHLNPLKKPNIRIQTQTKISYVCRINHQLNDQLNDYLNKQDRFFPSLNANKKEEDSVFSTGMAAPLKQDPPERTTTQRIVAQYRQEIEKSSDSNNNFSLNNRVLRDSLNNREQDSQSSDSLNYSEDIVDTEPNTNINILKSITILPLSMRKNRSNDYLNKQGSVSYTGMAAPLKQAPLERTPTQKIVAQYCQEIRREIENSSDSSKKSLRDSLNNREQDSQSSNSSKKSLRDSLNNREQDSQSSASLNYNNSSVNISKLMNNDSSSTQKKVPKYGGYLNHFNDLNPDSSLNDRGSASNSSWSFFH